MSDCSHIQHYRAAEPTPTQAAIWKRRELFRNLLSSRAVRDDGIDLKRKKKQPPPIPPAQKMELPEAVRLAPTDGNFIAGLVADVSSLMNPGAPQKIEFTYSLRSIQDAVCRGASVTHRSLVSPRRNMTLVVPRQFAIALCKHLTEKSYPEIGRAFKRDHTTCLHADRKMEPVIEYLADIIEEAPLDYLVAIGLKRCQELFPPPTDSRAHRYKDYI